MGYTTTFEGKLKLNKKLDKQSCEEIKILNSYNPYEESNPSYPESICQWIVDEDTTHIVWDGVEKFYYYIEWLEYIIEHILQPKNYILSGKLIAKGDEDDDFGKIIVKNNNVKYEKAKGKDLENHLKKRDEEHKIIMSDLKKATIELENKKFIQTQKRVNKFITTLLILLLATVCAYIIIDVIIKNPYL